MNGSPRRLIVLCPHFAPDIAPTGKVMTHIVEQWTQGGHEVHVVTSLPWYREHRVESGWDGKWIRRERTTWGSVTRIHPFPAKSKSKLVSRALAFIAFSVIAGVCAVTVRRQQRADTRVAHRGVDAVVAMSPPLTLGIIGWIVARLRRATCIFNVQDVFPDAAIATGAVHNKLVIAFATWLERFTYTHSDAVVVLSNDLQENVRRKIGARFARRVHVIENFVDLAGISPQSRLTPYRRELGIGEEVVVMYAGNVGFSQSLENLVECARRAPHITVLINGAGAALASLREMSTGLANVRFGDYQPEHRLAEVLATGDIHVVSLRSGLASVSVPSKTYSILAAGRCVVAAVDADSEIERLVERSGAGLSVAPDDPAALADALNTLVGDETKRTSMGAAGRSYITGHPSAHDVAQAYLGLLPDSLSNS